MKSAAVISRRRKVILPMRLRFILRTVSRRANGGIRFGAFLTACLLWTPCLALGQGSEATEPFFTVSSRQTYAPSQQPKVWVEFRQVDRLDFRIYRVKDPEQFFAKLKEAHS